MQAQIDQGGSISGLGQRNAQIHSQSRTPHAASACVEGDDAGVPARLLGAAFFKDGCLYERCSHLTRVLHVDYLPDSRLHGALHGCQVHLCGQHYQGTARKSLIDSLSNLQQRAVSLLLHQEDGMGAVPGHLGQDRGIRLGKAHQRDLFIPGEESAKHKTRLLAVDDGQHFIFWHADSPPLSKSLRPLPRKPPVWEEAWGSRSPLRSLHPGPDEAQA